MIRQAALYLATPEDVRAARVSVICRPVIFRAILTAVRAGVQRIGVPPALRSADLEAALATSPSARAALVWLDAPHALADEPTLLLPATALTPAPALARLLEVPPGGVLAESLASGAPVLTADVPLLTALRAPLVAGDPLGDALAREAKAREREPVAGQRWFVRVTGPGAVAEAEAQLWSNLGSPIDSRLDVAVHRRLSRWVTRAAVPLGFTPNSITVCSGVLGVAAAWCLWQGRPAWALAGVLVFLLAVVLDHTDGEVARLTLTESPVGEWLDVGIDTLVHALMVLAMGAATQRLGGGDLGLALGALAALGFIISSALAKWKPPRATADAVGATLERLTSRDGFYAMLILNVAALATAPALLPALMVLVGAGAHAYWVARAVYLVVRRG